MLNGDNLAYGTMDTDGSEVVAASSERVERPKIERRKTTYTFPIKIMPSPKSTTTSSTSPEFTEVETQAYYNESLDYNYISSRFAFSLGLKPDADREAKPRSKSVSKPKIPFKPKHLARSQTAPVAEIKPLQRSITEPLFRRVFAPLNRENTISEDTPASTSTNYPLPPRLPPRRTSTTATLVPSNSQAPPIFSLLEPTPEAIARSSLTSPLFPDADLNPFSPRPGATFGAMVADTPPRTAQRPKPLHTHTEGHPSLFEALNSHPVIPITNVPTIFTEEPEGISEEPEEISNETEEISNETERNLEGMGIGTGIGMGFGIGEEIRGREEDLDPNAMTGDLTLHWKSTPLSRYTQRTVFWIVPHAKFDVVFGHDETDFNIPIRNPPKWGLGSWGIGAGKGRAERNQFREGIRRGVLKKVLDQSNFSLLHSATNIMDAWLRPPYPSHLRAGSNLSDSKVHLLSGNGREEDVVELPLTLSELHHQLEKELHCADERRRKHEGKRAVNIWDVRAGKAVLAEQAKGASGEIRKLVGVVVKDVRERDVGKTVVIAGLEEAPVLGSAADVETETASDEIVHVENPLTTTSHANATDAANEDLAIQPQLQPRTSLPLSPLISTSPLQTEQIHINIPAPTGAPNPTPTIDILPNPQTFELSPTVANQSQSQSASSSLRVEFTDAQMQAQMHAQMDAEAELQAEAEAEAEIKAQMEKDIQAQMEREVQEQIEQDEWEERDEDMRIAPALPPRPLRFESAVLASGLESGLDSIKEVKETGSENENEKGSEMEMVKDKGKMSISTSTDIHIHTSLSKLRSAHALDGGDEDGEDEDDDEGDGYGDDGNEMMSEIMLAGIPVRKLELDGDGDGDFGEGVDGFEQMSEIYVGDRDAGMNVKERFEKLWETEDEGVHREKRVWRGRFRGVLGELLMVRGGRV
ncbi:hypothetical protein SBOR_5333 [Sclerotinia borealis F-4128]|uniref:Uncharacterized protein n=1 Tax=Sclerotinia borealis (strain F-4128) TaxID=1432307 RepID=W9CIA4_SCLBF|nr:hypothetical protein SBOR_5333 [Sclerotinia borealis F-4128]